eukprot:TRINITY_DN62040_c0_g1_i1.p1 TRINITY_DN62040_c0_g1~~TRINITY_DN62040_c0_g1_i1.p1  ORF type:complete len:1854 (-),score=353.52 TRINITY_DN62040_c0_g1_i1:34-4929(-)
MEQVNKKAERVEAAIDGNTPSTKINYSATMESVRALMKDYIKSTPLKCHNCESKSAKWSKDQFVRLSVKKAGEKLAMVCPPFEARNVVRRLWKNEKAILQWWIPGSKEHGADVFFMDAILVPPNRFRPSKPAVSEGGSEILHDQSQMLIKILRANEDLRSIILDTSADHESKKNAAADGVDGKVSTADAKESNSTSSGSMMRTVQAGEALQDAVNSFMDNTKGSLSAKALKNGIRQILEKKEGLFRMKMMGKRVNYAGRSVISPDLNVETTEIGVPRRIAQELTYPEVAAPHNVAFLRRLVRRGNVYPGATEVHQPTVFGSKNVFSLSMLDLEKRTALAKQLVTDVQTGKPPMTVFRHIRNGDPLLVNRQPTLHKPGIMAHICRVLRQESTIRMHYANCNTYNADFDGDEMNLHAPQDPVGRIEALEIARADRQYLVPTSGNPLRGLIQDHVIGGVMLSKRDTYLNRGDVCMLLYTGLRAALEGDLPTNWDQDTTAYMSRPWMDPNKFEIHPMRVRLMLDRPTIFRPAPLWTGKQVFSMLLKNIFEIFKRKRKGGKKFDGQTDVRSGLNFDSKSKTPGDIWNGVFDGNKEESTVMFRGTDLLMGVLDKSQFGASPFGLIHAIHEIVGSHAVGLALGSMARLYSLFLQMHGFTCAFRDLVLRDDVEVERRRKILGSRSIARNTINDWLQKHGINAPNGANSSLRELVQCTRQLFERDRARSTTEQELESAMLGKMKNSWGDVVNCCFPAGTRLSFPKNCFGAMVQTGAKGSKVNQSQVTCCLGQQELEGRQPPLMITRKSLPCFASYDLTSRTRGYITDRFLTGIRPQEFFFHCMAGREGLVDTAVKTSRSGYLQRCLVKHLESLKVCYDHSVRDNDGSVVQFLYGEDGVDVTASSHLYNFDLLHQNFDLRGSVSTSAGNVRQLENRSVNTKTASAYLRAQALVMSGNAKSAANQLSEVLDVGNDGAVTDLDELAQSRLRTLQESLLAQKKKWKKTAAAARESGSTQQLLDPIASLFTPCHFFGSTSERHEAELQKYVASAIADGNLTEEDAQEFIEQMRLKFMRSLIQPGEAVGVIAAQSMGEPSTQMTLNTFHLAGHGGANVTLGIPRLRELVQTAARNISTPLMSVEVLRDLAGGDSLRGKLTQAHALVRRFRQVNLLEILHRVVVHDKTRLYKGAVVRVYSVRLQFWPIKELCLRLPCLSHKMLENYLRGPFTKHLRTEVERLGGAVKRLQPTAQKKRKAASEDGDEDRAEGGGDEGGGDETGGKSKAKRRKAAGRGLREEAEGDAEVADAEDVADGGGAGDGAGDGEEDGSDEGSGMYESDDVLPDDENPLEERGVFPPESGSDNDDGEPRDPENDRVKKRRIAEPEKDTSFKAFLAQHDKDKSLSTSKAAPTPVGPDIFAEADSAQVVTAGKLVDDEIEFTVTLRHQDCPHRLLLPEVVYELCRVAELQDPIAKGVKKVHVKEEKDKVFIECEGVNLGAFQAMPLGTVDVNRIMTNDVRTFQDTYGIEAARSKIVREISGVFGHYGINVDFRHLSLIADFMTQSGDITPFNRLGMTNNTSPLQQMSFETTMQFMSMACKDAINDVMSSPASAIVVGQVPPVGTGMVSLLCDLQPTNPCTTKREFKF